MGKKVTLAPHLDFSSRVSTELEGSPIRERQACVREIGHQLLINIITCLTIERFDAAVYNVHFNPVHRHTPWCWANGKSLSA